LLVTRRVEPRNIYREIDWSLLVLFIGLFIVIAGVEKTVFGKESAIIAGQLQLQKSWILASFTALLSNAVSNVPAVLLLKPFVAHLPNQFESWLLIAMSSTLAGNLTVLGSIANLIVIERARPSVSISFLEYLKVGVPLSILTIGIGILFLR
jgi:Na+/H+ antiporter NhaD/arsenite permease-like protein